MRKRFRVLIIFLTVGIIITAGICGIKLFTLGQVTVISNRALIGLNILNGKNILFLDTAKTEEHLKKSNYFVRRISISKKYPSSLTVAIAERIPVAIVQNNINKTTIDEEGISLPMENVPSYIPVIDVSDIFPVVGNLSDWKIRKAHEIIRTSEDKGVGIFHVVLDNNKGIYSLFLSGDTEVIIPTGIDVNMLAASLQHIVTRFRIEGKNISKIDFRFDKPVVVLRNGDNNSSK